MGGNFAPFLYTFFYYYFKAAPVPTFFVLRATPPLFRLSPYPTPASAASDRPSGQFARWHNLVARCPCACMMTAVHTTPPVTYNPTDLTTITLPEGKWHSIRTAVLCLACDERTKGNHADADHWFRAYDALAKELDK